ncbi:MAG: hypothetical protein EOP86_13190 [Verrucomicrobiaceae bacterium]|nr:MAG: hypothetical protein EOP86_13190 [Verrucomicrobiaceae bacterium]
MIRRFFRRLLTPPMVVLAALFLFVEECLWKWGTAVMAKLARAPFVRALEVRLARLPAWAALVIFFLPGLMLLPVKITALFLIGKGHVASGMGVIVAAKVLGTAVVARFFAICKPTLMGVRWFHAAHDWILALKAWLYARLRAMPSWQKVVRLQAALRRKLRTLRPGYLGRRWKAIAGRLRWRFLNQRKPRHAPPPPARSQEPPLNHGDPGRTRL